MAESFIRTERVVPKDINEVTTDIPFSPYYILEMESFLADQVKEGLMLKEISANNVSFTYVYLPILFDLAVMSLAIFVLKSFPPLQSKSSDSYFIGAFIAAFVADLIQKYMDVQTQKAFLKAMEPQNYLNRYQKADWKIRKAKNSWYGLKGLSTMLITVLITFLLRFFFEI